MTKGNYTIIRKSGKSTFYPDTDYYMLMNVVYGEFMSAGSDWDHPNMLLLDGEVVMKAEFQQVAYCYGQYRGQLFSNAEARAREKFAPEWLQKPAG